MASRILDRRQLREQADAAEQAGIEDTDADEADDDPPKKKKPARPKVAKPKGPPKPRKPRAPKVPPRLRARWAVYDGGMKAVAVFDYSQLGAAEKRLADLLETRKGIHFLRMFKEPMPQPEALA